MLDDRLGGLTAIKKPESLRQEVYDRIKDAILTHQFAPGQKLDEVRIGQMLGVSRTPVREALNRLAHERLAISEMNRGIYVARITSQDLLEILDIREVLEGLAVRVFTERAQEAAVLELEQVMESFSEDTVEQHEETYNLANVKFHSIIVNGTGQERLIHSLDSLYDHLAHAKTMRLITVTRRAKRSLEEHFAIIDSIKQGKARQAEEQMRMHIRSLKDDVLHNLDVINR